MLKIVAIVAAVIVAAVAVVLILAASKPDVFRVQRAAVINAPADKIFPLINDFRNWNAWSPYETKDPAMKRSYHGQPSGKGAVYEWEGDSNVGSGRLAIADASPPSSIRLDLDMFRPIEAHNVVDFTLEPQAGAASGATNVTWAMRGNAPYLAKIVHVFFDMDSMVGKDFETGLANLKRLAEKSPGVR